MTSRAPSQVTSVVSIAGSRTWPDSRPAWGAAMRLPARARAALALVVVEEDVLAPDAAQDAQAGDGVRAQGGQAARGLALGRLGRVQRAHERGGERGQHRHADEHDEAQLDRGRQQDERHDDPRDDRAHEAREDVEGPADAHRVGGHGVDHVAGGDLVGQGGAGGRDVASDELDRAVGRVHPVGDGELVAQRAADRLDEAEADDDADPAPERGVAVALCRGRWRRRRRPTAGPG